MRSRSSAWSAQSLQCSASPQTLSCGSETESEASVHREPAGIKYMYLSSREGGVKVVRAKKDRNGVHCIRTNQTFIICTYQEPIVPEQAALVTEKLGDYLVGVGY